MPCILGLSASIVAKKAVGCNFKKEKAKLEQTLDAKGSDSLIEQCERIFMRQLLTKFDLA